MVLTGLSDGLNGLLIGAKAADLYPPRVLDTVMGVVETGRGLGIALGPVLSGALFDWKQDYVLAFSVSIVLTLVGVALLGGTADAGRGPLLTEEGQQGGPSKVVGRAIKMTL